MSLLHVEYTSRLLRKAMGMDVLLPLAPPPSGGRYPVLYLLHGLSDNHTAWRRYTALERHLSPLPLIVVLPDGKRSF